MSDSLIEYDDYIYRGYRLEGTAGVRVNIMSGHVLIDTASSFGEAEVVVDEWLGAR